MLMFKISRNRVVKQFQACEGYSPKIAVYEISVFSPALLVHMKLGPLVSIKRWTKPKNMLFVNDLWNRHQQSLKPTEDVNRRR